MASISGTSGVDTLTGTFDDDLINALGGRDTINATQGADIVDGGTGTDRLIIIMSDASRFATAATGSRTYVIDNGYAGSSIGGLGTSFVNIERVTLELSGTGDFGDTVDSTAFSGGFSLDIRLGNGNDVVYGGSGNETVWARGGYNWIDTGGGLDSVFLRSDFSGGHTVTITGSGNLLETVQNGIVTNTVFNAEYVYIGNDVDTPFVADGLTYTVDASGYSGTAQIVFYDHNGDDVFIGSSGADVFSNLYDVTVGNDTYTGNGGADIYDYTVAINALNNDVITDFDSDDVIDFQYNDGIIPGQLRCQFWIGSAAFSGVVGQYRYEASGGQTFIQIDTNGDAVADRVLTLSNGQFALGETFAGSNILQMIGISGTSGSDTLTGTLGNDSIYAQGSSDIIYGSQGTDFIDGGMGGGDRLFMNTGTASLFTLATGARTYTIGASTITDSSGALNTSFTAVERIAFSTIGNGDFDDVIDASAYASAHAAGLDIRLGNGDNMVTGSSTNDRVFTGFGSNIINGGSGGYDQGFANADASGDITITITNVGGTLVIDANGAINQFINFDEVWVQGVGAGAVTLDASAYTDIAGLLLVLVGHNGSDIMIGSAGNDLFANITGQVLGTDIYTGNGGADIYDYTWAADSMNGDTITDFDTDDVIDLRYNSLNPFGSPVRADIFIGASQFSGVAGEYRYQIQGTQTVVQVDSDGDMIVDQTLTISNGAFILSETFTGSNILTLATPIEQASGIVADGYLAGATVFIDTNGNLMLDDGEASTVTDVNGNFSLNVNYDGILVAIGGLNTDTGIANSMTLAAPDGSSVVNPLTTLVHAVIEFGSSATDAQALVLAALGLDPSLDLLNLDLIAAAASSPAALEAQKAAAIIANLVATVEGAGGAGATTESLLIEALVDLVSTGSLIDLTDVATLTPLLTEALPGIPVDGIAEEISFESKGIQAATSLAGISAAQIDAHVFNHIAGSSGDDILIGTIGRDRIVGGNGKDFLRGGGGDDVFVAEITASQVKTKAGNLSIDVIFDFNPGDKIDLSGIDAKSTMTGHQQFSWNGTNANKSAGDVSYKTYASVQGAEKALGIDIDGVAGPSPYSGPVTVVFGNVDGGSPDFAMVLIGTGSVSAGDFIFA